MYSIGPTGIYRGYGTVIDTSAASYHRSDLSTAIVVIGHLKNLHA